MKHDKIYLAYVVWIRSFISKYFFIVFAFMFVYNTWGSDAAQASRYLIQSFIVLNMANVTYIQ